MQITVWLSISVKLKKVFFIGPRYVIRYLLYNWHWASCCRVAVTFSHNLHSMSTLRIFSQFVINVVICFTVWRANVFPLNTPYCFLFPASRAFCMPCGFSTTDLIGKIDVYLCKAIRWGYNGNLKLLSELLHDADMKLFRKAPTIFTSYFPLWSLCQWHSALLISAVLLSSTTIITSTNVHLFYDVCLMRHINCLCCHFGFYSLFHVTCIYLFFTFNFFLGNAVLNLHRQYIFT